MPWRELPPGEAVTFGRARFLLDENVDVALFKYLKGKGFNVRTVAQRGLRHRDDADVLACAWRENRILITHDDGFLDESKHPPNRNPGVVVLPGGDGRVATLAAAAKIIVDVVGNNREIFKGSTLRISDNLQITVHIRDHETGARKSIKFNHKGDEWIDEELA